MHLGGMVVLHGATDLLCSSHVGLRYSFRMFRCMGVLVFAMLVSCQTTGPGCACGQSYDRDPFGSDSDDQFYVGPDHDESVHCICRCGDGPQERLAPSETCEAYEGPCRNNNGELANYTCE